MINQIMPTENHGSIYAFLFIIAMLCIFLIIYILKIYKNSKKSTFCKRAKELQQINNILLNKDSYTKLQIQQAQQRFDELVEY